MLGVKILHLITVIELFFAYAWGAAFTRSHSNSGRACVSKSCGTWSGKPNFHFCHCFLRPTVNTI